MDRQDRELLSEAHRNITEALRLLTSLRAVAGIGPARDSVVAAENAVNKLISGESGREANYRIIGPSSGG